MGDYQPSRRCAVGLNQRRQRGGIQPRGAAGTTPSGAREARSSGPAGIDRPGREETFIVAEAYLSRSAACAALSGERR